MNGRKPLVTGYASLHLAITFQMIQEFASDCRCQLFHCHTINGATSLPACKRQQQFKGVSIAGLGVAGKIAFGHQMLQQETTDPRAKEVLILHGPPPLHIVQSAG